MPIITQKRPPIRKIDKGCRLLSEMAYQIGAGGQMPPIRELARKIRISKATLNDCLDDLEARDIVVRRHRSGIFVSPRIGQKTIGLVFGQNIFDPAQSPMYSQFIERCSVRSASHHVNFRFFLDIPELDPQGSALPVHRDLEEAIRDGKLHGILLVSRKSPEQEAWLTATKIPMFCLAIASQKSVGVDHEGIVRLGVQTLVEQGCKRLGMITPYGEHRDITTTDLITWSQALREVGRSDSEPRIWQKLVPVLLVPQNETREDDGWHAAHAWFGPESSPESRPDGVLCIDDMMTSGFISGLHTLGFKPGRDVLVASHANAGSPVLRRQKESISLLEIDPDILVEGMFDCLECRMNGLPDPQTPVVARPTLRVGKAVNFLK